MYYIQFYLGDWLLQIVSTFFPMLLFQSFFRKKYGRIKTQKIILTILCAISIIICMSFPVKINQGYILDFRFTPLLIGFLYAGYKAGMILSLIVIVYRYIIGGVGFYFGGLPVTILYLIIFFLLRKQLPKWNARTNTIFSYSMLTLSVVVFAAGTQFLNDYSLSNSEIVLWIIFSALNFLTFWAVRYIQTSLREVEQLTEKMIFFEKQHTLNHLYTYLSQEMVPSIEKMREAINKMNEGPFVDTQANYLKELARQVEGLEVNQKYYLSFFEQSSIEKQLINLNDEIDHVTKIIKPYSEHYQVQLVVLSTLGEESVIKGNPSMIRLALLTVIKNAIEASEPEGRVEIALHDLVERVYIVVEDYGGGMESSVLNSVEGPQESNKRNGSGLGLATVLKITENHGGIMEINSKLNKGTVFSLYLPKV